MKTTGDRNNNTADFGELLPKGIVFRENKFVNKEAVGRAILAQMEASRQRSLRRAWMAAASVMLVLLTTATYLTSNREFVTGDYELALSLPDGSQVQMREHSRLSYNRITWSWDRNISFKGVACFNVTKGEHFTVRTALGSVTVLGTEFMVQSGTKTLMVECFSGAVSVKTDMGEQILHSAEKVDCSSGGMIFTPARKLLPEFLEFNNASLNDVADKIEELFGVTVTPRDICLSIVYDGLLPTANLNEALEIVMSSCGLTYSIKADQIILSRHVDM